MKRVFLGTSFSGQIDAATGEVVPAFKQFISQVLSGMREAGLEVFAAVEYEGWKVATHVAPEVSVLKDIEEINAADVFVALVHDKPSTGVQFELGYAVAKGKEVIIACAVGDQLAFFNQGAISAGLMTLVNYDDAKTLTDHLVVAINAPTD